MIECNLPNTYIQRRTTHEPSLIVYGGNVGSCSEWAEWLNCCCQYLGKACKDYGIDTVFEQIMADWGNDE